MSGQPVRLGNLRYVFVQMHQNCLSFVLPGVANVVVVFCKGYGAEHIYDQWLCEEVTKVDEGGDPERILRRLVETAQQPWLKAVVQKELDRWPLTPEELATYRSSLRGCSS